MPDFFHHPPLMIPDASVICCTLLGLDFLVHISFNISFKVLYCISVAVWFAIPKKGKVRITTWDNWVWGKNWAFGASIPCEQNPRWITTLNAKIWGYKIFTQNKMHVKPRKSSTWTGKHHFPKPLWFQNCYFSVWCNHRLVPWFMAAAQLK